MQMKRTLLIVAIISNLSCVDAVAIDIQGRIVSKDGKLLGMSTVVLQTVDSVFVNGTTSDDNGVFSLYCDTVPFRLTVSSLGYGSVSQVYHTGEVGDIILDESAKVLGEVEVRTNRRVMTIRDGRIVASASEIMKGKVVTDAFDLTKYVPGIIREGSDKIRLAGTQSTTLLVDGKTLNMSVGELKNYLKALPPERVERIELIYDAPPELHVAGAVINVVLKKINGHEMTGQLSSSMKNASRNSFEELGSLFYDTRKWSLYGMYSFAESHDVGCEKMRNRHNVGETVYDVDIDMDVISTSLAHRVYANATYKCAEKTDVSIGYSAGFTPKDNSIVNAKNSYFGDRFKKIGGNGNWHSVSLDLTHNALKSSVDYMYYSTKNSRNSKLANDVQSSEFSYLSKQTVNRVHGYADWSGRMAKNVNFLSGSSFTYSWVSNTVENNSQSADGSTTKSDEYTATAYVGLSGNAQGGRLTYRATVNSRYHHSYDYHRLQFYPNASATWVLNDSHILMAAYSWSRAYPSYWDMQNQTVRDDEYVVSKSNPAIRPATTNAASLTYLFRSKYMLQMSYVHTDDNIVMDTYQNPDRLELVAVNRNMNKESFLVFTGNVPVSIGQWYYGNYSLVESLKKEKCNDSEVNYNAKKWITTLYSNHVVTFSHKPMLSMDVTASYTTGVLSHFYSGGSFGGVDVGVKWQFCNKHAILSLRGSDIFKSSMPILRKRVGMQWQDYDIRAYRRSVSLTFTYKFRNFKEKQANLNNSY